MDLEGRTALVTGGSRGHRLAIAQRLPRRVRASSYPRDVKRISPKRSRPFEIKQWCTR